MFDRRSASWRFIALLLGTLGFWMSREAQATDPRQWGPSGLPIRQGHHIEWYRAAHRAEDGHTLMVWSDTRTGDRDVYAQLLDPQGDIAAGWPEDGLSVIDFDYRQEDPEPIAVTGGFVVAWIEFRFDSTGDVFAQKLDYQGNKLWDPNGVLVDTHVVYMVNETSLRAAHDGQGGAIIAWEDARRGDMGDIYAQRVTSNGQRAWNQVLAVTDHNGYQKGITADGDGQGNMIVAWNDPRNGGSDTYAAKITPAGALPWGGVGGRLVCDHNGQATSVKICPDLTTGGAYLAWIDDREGPTLVNLYMQRLDAATGNGLWQTNGVLLCDAPNAQRGVRVAPSINGGVQDGVITCWDDLRENGQVNEVYAQKTNSSGVHLWTANGVKVCGNAGPGSSGEPREGSRLTSDFQGGGMYVWDDTRANGDILQYDCYIGHLDLSGQHVCGECGDPVATAAHQQTEALLRMNGAGTQVIVVYLDYQRGSKNLRYKKVDVDDCEAHDAAEIIFGLDGNAKDPVNIMMNPGQVGYVWEDNRGGNNGRAIFYQILDTTYAKPFPFIPDNGDTLAPDNEGHPRYDQSEPFIVTDGNNGFFCAFLDLRESAKQVRLTRVGSDGTIVGPLAGSLVAASTVDQQNAMLAEDGSGGCYVCWSGNDTTFQMDVHAMRMDANCQPMWSQPVQLSNNPSNDDILQGIVADQSGNAVAIWTTGGFNTHDVYAAKIGPDGTVAWTLPISTAPRDQDAAQVIADNQGGVYFAWEDSRDELAGKDIYAQHVNAAGQTQWTSNGRLVVTMTEDQKVPRLAVEPDGFLYVVWQDFRNGNHLDLYGQKLNTQGQRQWPDQGRLICDRIGDQYDQQMLLEWDNGLYMVWVDNRAQFFEDIYGIHYDADGGIEDSWWGAVEDGLGGAVNIEYQNQNQPALAHDYHGGTMACWVDWRSSGKEPLQNLWGNWINDYTVSVREIPAPLPKEYQLTQNYPNPFNPSTQFEFTIPLTAAVKVRIFNSLGQEVKTLVNKVMTAGTYRVEFDASALSSGTYFYRLEAPGFQTVKKMTLLR